MNHEEAVAGFHSPGSTGAVSGVSEKPENRKKFIGVLAHFKHLDPKFRDEHCREPEQSFGACKITSRKECGYQMLGHFRER
jgi:hypothetical protein